MIETNKFKLGLFVTGTVILFIAAVSCMGLFDFLSAKAYLYTTVTESVQGLNNGSQVKLRGVPIGKITDIIIHMDNRNISLQMEVDLKRFSKSSQSEFSHTVISREEFYQLLETEIRKGLRCRLELDGITGMKYLEIDFFRDVKLAPAENPVEIAGKYVKSHGEEYFYVPSTPSMLASLRLSMTDILARIAMIDFDGIANRSSQLLEKMNEIIEPKRVDRLIADLDKCVEAIRQTSENLGSLLDKNEVNKTLEDVRNAVQAITRLSAAVRRDMEKAKIPETVAGLRDLTGDIGDSSRNMNVTLQHVNEAVDALTEFARYLNEHPSALIFGRPKKKEDVKSGGFFSDILP
ncbi:MAG: MCE family protein [Lentisphaeria bacterium]|nr:MCE family protein [Lentisphaeria bacterium]